MTLNDEVRRLYGNAAGDYYDTLKSKGVPLPHRTTRVLGFLDGHRIGEAVQRPFNERDIDEYHESLDVWIPKARYEARLQGFIDGWNAAI